jgi:predicted kinase
MFIIDYVTIKIMINLEKQIVVLAGLPLSGKTSLGEKLAQESNAVFLDIDEARQKLVPGKEWLGPEMERAIMLQAYEYNHQRARSVLQSGHAAIVAATYSRPAYHDMITTVATLEQVPLHFFLLKLPDESVASRIEQRRLQGSNSNITSLESYTEVKDRYQPPSAHTSLDASQPVEQLATAVFNSLKRSS